jgi:hypothetical protein
MIITKKALPRRTFLKGMQATLALPLLDAMIPAATALANTAANFTPRLSYVFMPMGTDIARWTPRGGEILGELPPVLSPLEKVKDQVSVITNLELQNSYPGTHDTSNSGFLSTAFAKHTESSDYRLGTTADQIAAKVIGQDTQLPSLELSMDLNPLAGVCNNGYACVYTNNLSWSSPTTPLPSEAHPRIVFERLFGEGGSLAERHAALRSRASLLDSFREDIARLKRLVGVGDGARIDQYLDSVREIERQIQLAEAAAEENLEGRDFDRPVGVPAAFADHAALMFDLQLLAFQADITRVCTFQLTRELSNRTYPEIGVPEPHHPTSHHGNDPVKVEKIAQIGTFHVSLFADFLEKLRATPDGDGSLLDNTVLLYGSGMGNPSLHDHINLPILVAGGASYGMRGGRHIEYENGTPLANLHMTLLDRVGVQLDSFGDSTGKIEDLFDPVPV